MNFAFGLMNREISHGHAIRSIFGCSRVIQFLSPASSLLRVGNSFPIQPETPPSRNVALTPAAQSDAATPGSPRGHDCSRLRLDAPSEVHSTNGPHPQVRDGTRR